MSGAFSAAYSPKPSAAELDYSYSFAAEIAENEPGDTITAVTLTISPADGSLGASRITATSTGVTFWLAGGVSGTNYTIEIVAPTVEGRTLVAAPAPMISVE